MKYLADQRRKLRLLVWIMPDITYNVGLGYVACLRGVYAAVARRRAEGVVCLYARNCRMNSETAQNSSLTSQEKVKPGLTLMTRKKEQRRYNVTLRRVRAPFVAVLEQ